MDYKITKIQKYGVYSSEKIGTQYYYIVYLRVYTDATKKYYYRVKFLFYFDAEDICEYISADTYSADDVRAVRDDFAVARAESICSYKTIGEIIDEANETIRRYA